MKSATGSSGQSLVEHVLAVRARGGVGSVAGSFWGPNERFWQLNNSLHRLGCGADPELYRHFPIAAVAALEGHFKLSVAAIVDSGRGYAERGLRLAKERFRNSPELIPEIHDRSITIGELVAHWLPFSQLSHYESTFDTLLDLGFKMATATAVDPSYARGGSGVSDPIVSDVSRLWRHVAEAFEMRHILAHEAASSYEITFEMARSAVESCAMLCDATEAVIWSTAWSDVPLTQLEMNASEKRQVDDARQRLATVMRSARTDLLGTAQYAWLTRNHFAWRSVTRDFVDWGASKAVGHSMFPLLVYSGQKVALVRRADEIESLMHYMRP
ncbi:hypothetical protein [Stenotrophomonas sp.]|uniref:hypothetical protein n=1 Tax=Stenotrophomonas sp. TaxID=69392 RepID=UPI00289F4097|nr:hypothetical protein [Stenotrophomonas sp.]